MQAHSGVAFAALVLAVGGLAAAQQPLAPAGDAAKGQSLFMTDGCYECHGTIGQGARGTGPSVARTLLPFEAFLQQLRQPSNEMPPYEAPILTDAAAADIYAYLQSLPPPVAAKSVPLLNQ
jgi:ubiquinol-cytochrome c reductase cytochrome c subunit